MFNVERIRKVEGLGLMCQNCRLMIHERDTCKIYSCPRCTAFDIPDFLSIGVNMLTPKLLKTKISQFDAYLDQKYSN